MRRLTRHVGNGGDQEAERQRAAEGEMQQRGALDADDEGAALGGMQRVAYNAVRQRERDEDAKRDQGQQPDKSEDGSGQVGAVEQGGGIARAEAAAEAHDDGLLGAAEIFLV